jgi:hypothetical protein
VAEPLADLIADLSHVTGVSTVPGSESSPGIRIGLSRL